MVSKFLPDSMKFGNMVSKATSDDEIPTPGYLQEELKRLTWDANSCSTLEDSMIARLEKKSCNVRLKTLRLMKILVETGSPNFKRDMQRRTQTVRDCLHFRGDPHPTMGDLPSKMVRDTAQEVINAIFDTESTADRKPPPPPAQPAPAPAAAASARPAASMSSGAPSFSSSSSSSSQPRPAEPKKYTGFGSESFGMKGNDSAHRSIDSYFSNTAASAAVASQAAHQQTSVNELMNQAGSALSAGISQLTGNKPAGMLGSSPPRTSAEVRPTPQRSQIAVSEDGWQIPPDVLSDAVPSTAATSSAAAPPPPRPVIVEPVRSAAGQYEETLVQSITAPGGVRAAPPKEDLKALCSKAKSLDMPLLIMLLCSKLEADAWQSRLKTLHVLEALLKAPDEEVVKSVRKLLRGRLPLLETLTHETHQSLADLAAKVAKEVAKAEAEPPKPSPPPPSAPADNGDLLGLGGPAQGGGGGGGMGGMGGWAGACLQASASPATPQCPRAEPRPPHSPRASTSSSVSLRAVCLVPCVVCGVCGGRWAVCAGGGG